MSIEGKTLAVISAGYLGKRRSYVRLAELGARLVILEEPGHWSAELVDDGVAVAWLPVAVTGDPDADAAARVTVSAEAGIRPDGVVTFWETSIGVAARVATLLGLPANPTDAIDAVQQGPNSRAVHGARSARRRGLTVRSLDECSQRRVSRVPRGRQARIRCSAVGCIRVDDVESLPRCTRWSAMSIGRRTLVTSCRQRSVVEQIPRWRRVRRRLSCTTASVCSRASRRTGRPSNHHSRKPGLIARPGPQPPRRSIVSSNSASRRRSGSGCTEGCSTSREVHDLSAHG